MGRAPRVEQEEGCAYSVDLEEHWAGERERVAGGEAGDEEFERRWVSEALVDYLVRVVEGAHFGWKREA